MKRINMKRALSVLVTLCLLATTVLFAPVYAANGIFVGVTAAMDGFDLTEPDVNGEYNDKTMPDSIDLAARGRLALDALLNIAEGAPGDYWGDVVNAIVLARNMSGDTTDMGRDAAAIEKMMAYANTGHLLTDNSNRVNGAVQSAFCSMYKISPYNNINGAIALLLDDISRIRNGSANTAYSNTYGIGGYIGYSDAMSYNGAALIAMMQWLATGDSNGSAAGMSATYKTAMLNRSCWSIPAGVNPGSSSNNPNGQRPKAVDDFENGMFRGSIASYTEGLLNLLSYTKYNNNI